MEQAPAVIPEIVPGWDGLALTVVRTMQRCTPFTQFVRGVTQMLPPANVAEKLRDILLLVDEPVAPDGSVQV